MESKCGRIRGCQQATPDTLVSLLLDQHHNVSEVIDRLALIGERIFLTEHQHVQACLVEHHCIAGPKRQGHGRTAIYPGATEWLRIGIAKGRVKGNAASVDGASIAILGIHQRGAVFIDGAGKGAAGIEGKGP